MTLLLVYGSKTQEHAKSLLAGWSESGIRPIILEIDARAPRDLLPEGARLCTYETYLKETDLEILDEKAAEFARQWYRDGSRDVTRMDSISQGAVHELEVFYKAVLLFKNLECARRLIEKERIGEVFLGFGVSLERWAWEAMCGVRGIRVNFLSLDVSSQSIISEDDQGVQKRVSSVRKAIAQIPDFSKMAFKEIFYRKKPADRPSIPHDKMVLAVQEGRSTCQTWLNQLASCPRFALVDLQSRSNDSNDLQLMILKLRFVQLMILKLRFGFMWFCEKKRLKKNPVFRYSDIDIWPYWKHRVQSMIVRDFPYTHEHVKSLVNWLRFNSIKAMVIPWHALSRLHFEAAQSCNIPLIVMQDSWIPGEHFPLGYGHFMRCHHLFVWGDISAGWARQLEGVQIHTVGNPQASTLGDTSDFEPQKAFDKNGPVNVLLAHQCWGPWTCFHSPLDTNDTWEVFAQAARRLPREKFTGKIHPLVNDPNHEWPGRSDEILKWASNLGLENFSVAPIRSSAQDTLEASHLVVTYYSLIAVEAMTQGIPVAMINVTAKRDLFPELVQVYGAPAIRSVDDLVHLVERIRDVGISADSQTSGGQKLMNKIFGAPVSVVDTVLRIVEGDS